MYFFIYIIHIMFSCNTAKFEHKCKHLKLAIVLYAFYFHSCHMQTSILIPHYGLTKIFGILNVNATTVSTLYNKQETQSTVLFFSLLNSHSIF